MGHCNIAAKIKNYRIGKKKHHKKCEKKDAKKRKMAKRELEISYRETISYNEDEVESSKEVGVIFPECPSKWGIGDLIGEEDFQKLLAIKLKTINETTGLCALGALARKKKGKNLERFGLIMRRWLMRRGRK